MILDDCLPSLKVSDVAARTHFGKPIGRYQFTHDWEIVEERGIFPLLEERGILPKLYYYHMATLKLSEPFGLSDIVTKKRTSLHTETVRASVGSNPS